MDEDRCSQASETSLHRRMVALASRQMRLACFCCCSKNEREIPESTIKRWPLSVPEAHVLVLGASDTGKSTFMKQMRYVFGDSFPVSDRRRYHPHIRRNLLESLNKMVTAAEHFGISLNSTIAEEAAGKFKVMEDLEKYIEEDAEMDSRLPEAAKVLWEDQGVQQTYLRGNEFHLMTNADHFITNADRILQTEYIPTVDDILRMRYPTKSSFTSTYDFGEMKMTLQDMGGERSEREEWVRLLHHPTAILFLASLSEYDQCVEEAHEEENKNRVEESLEIFQAVLNFPTFENTPVILLLNKTDVFARKIKYHPLSSYFPCYTGDDGDEEEGRNFLAGKYERLARTHGRHFVARFTEATNTENFKAIFTFVKNNVSRSMMCRGGLL